MAIITDNFSGTPLEGKGLTFEVDYAGRTDSQPVYIGYATPGLDGDTGEPVWKIMFCEYSAFPTGDLIRRTWADGNTLFDNVWNDRVTLAYS